MNIDLKDKNVHLIIKANQTLSSIIDPELGINIVDMGLIYEILFLENRSLDLKMTLSSKACPLGEYILNAVQTALENSFPNYQIDIQLVWEPSWSIDSISEEGRILLNL